MYKKLLEQAQQKAAAATALLEGEDPNVEEANKLLAAAEKLRDQAKAMKAAKDLEKETDDAVKAFDKLAMEPAITPSGLSVVADEEDKEKAVTTLSTGEFFQTLALEPEKLRMYRSKNEPDHYNLSEAIGGKSVGSLTAARDKRAKAITGLSESVPADGGFLVQTDWGGSLMERVYNVGDLLRLVDMTGVSGNANGMAFYANAETARANGSRYGGARYYWLAEGAEKTISHQTYRRIELALNKIIVYIPATDELLQDTTALENEINTIAPEEIRFGVEDSIIRGTNAGMPLGILNSPCLVTQAAEVGQAADTVVSENIVNMWSRRWAGARDYVWLINQDVGPQLYQMNLGVGTGGSLTYLPPGGLSASPYGSLMGRPVIESEYCDTVGDVGDIILASFSQYKMIEKGGIQAASSIHVRFVYDESVFRFVYRVDGEPKWNLPLTPYQSTITQGPFVALAARA